MKRRDFLVSAAAIAGMAATSRGWPQQQSRDRAKLDRVAIMGYSFDRIIKNPDEPTNPARTLDIMELPQMYADRYGVHNIEMQSFHFLSIEPAYFREFRERVERARSRVSQINLEFGGLNMSLPNHRRRLEAVVLTRWWVDQAVMLGCPRVMVNQGTLDPEIRPAAVEALRMMGQYGRSKGVRITVENRGANWEATTEVVRAAGVHTNPDLGFPDQESQLKGIRLMFPMHSGSVHVKLNPERYHLPTALALLRELGYDGLYSIEAGNNVDPDPYLAVQKIMDVLLAHI